MYDLIGSLNSDKDFKKKLFSGNFGIEREVLRVDKHGRISQTSHPFPDNKYITLDFSESQIEIVTPSFRSIEECKKFVDMIMDIIYQELEDEDLWNYSMPPKIISDDDINIAFPFQKEHNEYRIYLAEKYGKAKQTISGIHFNFSFDEDAIRIMYKYLNKNEKTFKEFKNDVYLKIARKYIEYQWITSYLFGYTPIADTTFSDELDFNYKEKKQDLFFGEFSKSIRNSDYGYKNKEKYKICYYSIDNYVRDIGKLVEERKLISNKEYYNCMRLKNSKGYEFLTKEGIEYLEIRNIDIFPFDKSGVNVKSLEFLHLFFIYLLFEEEQDDYFGVSFDDFSENNKIASFFGENDYVNLVNGKNIKENMLEIMNKMNVFFEKSGYSFDKLFQDVFNNRDKSKQIRKNILDKGYKEYFLSLSDFYKKESLEKPYNLKDFEDMELSTQIVMKSAFKKGYDIEILDRFENFISISNGIKKEYIVQATKTSLDNYSTILAMENKVVTKKILSENGIRVAKGESYSTIEELKDKYNLYKQKRIIIKPKCTNFGIGITIFKTEFSEIDFFNALEIAFSKDKGILIEEFLEGKEYRIFVLDGKVQGVLHRVPANVKGDGVLDISQLVKEKNKDILRGKNYRTPLEKINLGKEEEIFLSGQNLDFNYIPKKDEIVFLRENSNISTGGDSIDFTDDIDITYKNIAIKSAHAVNAKICGVDMMIKDIKNKADDTNYGVVELNFNPAIHIHCYPYKGKNRNLGEKILDLLF